jgi:L-alanine-DL-glutamate epimerase-like enolase superfamily enzyme
VKISEIRVYQIDLPLVEGRYSWSEGKYVEVFDSTVVELVTDDGLSGYGEVCPLGPFYLPAFGPGARAGIAELSGSLIGQDPTAIGPINQLMDAARPPVRQVRYRHGVLGPARQGLRKIGLRFVGRQIR